MVAWQKRYYLVLATFFSKWPPIKVDWTFYILDEIAKTAKKNFADTIFKVRNHLQLVVLISFSRFQTSEKQQISENFYQKIIKLHIINFFYHFMDLNNKRYFVKCFWIVEFELYYDLCKFNEFSVLFHRRKSFQIKLYS